VGAEIPLFEASAATGKYVGFVIYVEPQNMTIFVVRG
jgi:hypothetical protein